MSKQREDSAESNDDDREPVEGADEQITPEVHTDEGGEPVVSVPKESNRQRRRREQAEETVRLVKEAVAPFQQQIQTFQSMMPMLAQQRQAPAQQQEPANELESKWMSKRERMGEITQLMRSATDTAQLDKLTKEYHKLDFESANLVAESRAQAAQEQFSRANPPAPHPVAEMFQREFKDMMAAPQRARDLAKGIFLTLQAESDGTVDEMELHRKAMTQAAERLGIRKPKGGPAPSDTQRGRFAGSPPSSQGSRGGTGRQLTADEKKIARAWGSGSGLTPEQAYVEWPKFVGKEYFEA
jgi:hypothetical protein